MTCTAARSHSFTPTASTAPSTAPSATSMCAQKSPSPRACQARRASSRDVALEREAEDCIRHLRDRRHADGLATGECPRSSLRPPPAPERRRRDDAEADDPRLLERDERRPDRDPARIVPSPVDGVEDPAARAPGRRAVLFPEDRVSRALGREQPSQLGLHRAIGLGDGREVGLRLDREARAEVRQGDRVRCVCEPERECQIGAHTPTLSRARRGN